MTYHRIQKKTKLYRDTLEKIIAKEIAQLQAAKLLGVDVQTLRRDLRKKYGHHDLRKLPKKKPVENRTRAPTKPRVDAGPYLRGLTAVRKLLDAVESLEIAEELAIVTVKDEHAAAVIADLRTAASSVRACMPT